MGQDEPDGRWLARGSGGEGLKGLKWKSHQVEVVITDESIITYVHAILDPHQTKPTGVSPLPSTIKIMEVEV